MNILIENVLLEGEIRDIFIEDGTITEIANRCGKTADRRINGKNKAALPSFVNAHTHAAMTLFRGYADDMPLKTWLEEKIWPLEAKFTEEDVYWGSRLACLEMIKTGTTVFNDMYWHWEATAKAACDAGIRGLISAVFIDMFHEDNGNRQIEENLRLFELSPRYRPNVTFTLGPHALYTVSRKSLEWIRDFSEKHETLIHMHLSETGDEVHFCQDRYGMRPVEFLDSIGLLSPRYIGCHGVVLEEPDGPALKKRGAGLVHMPVSNLKLAVDTFFPYALMDRWQIPFCFGTDGCASNNHLDLFETMKFASLLAKFSQHEPTAMNAAETFRRATAGAANILGLGDWTIAVGNSPDIILIDLTMPEMVPNFDLCSNLVYAGSGHIVDTVIAMGQVVMENRVVPGEEYVLQKAAETARSLIER